MLPNFILQNKIRDQVKQYGVPGVTIY